MANSQGGIKMRYTSLAQMEVGSSVVLIKDLSLNKEIQSQYGRLVTLGEKESDVTNGYKIIPNTVGFNELSVANIIYMFKCIFFEDDEIDWDATNKLYEPLESQEPISAPQIQPSMTDMEVLQILKDYPNKYKAKIDCCDMWVEDIEKYEWVYDFKCDGTEFILELLKFIGINGGY